MKGGKTKKNKTVQKSKRVQKKVQKSKRVQKSKKVQKKVQKSKRSGSKKNMTRRMKGGSRLPSPAGLATNMAGQLPSPAGLATNMAGQYALASTESGAQKVGEAVGFVDKAESPTEILFRKNKKKLTDGLFND